MPKRCLIIAGIGTDVGKTIVSAVLCKTLEAHYWKPISCGSNDSDIVGKWIGSREKVLPSRYPLIAPISPHASAAREGIEIDSSLSLPKCKGLLVVEMAGGIFAPATNSMLSIDLFRNWHSSWILVVRHYLGSINHSLLTLEAMQTRGISPMGIIISGKINEESESAICQISGISIIGRVDEESEIDCSCIDKYAQKWKRKKLWKQLRN